MDCFVSLNDLFNDGFRFLFIHLPNLVDSVIVTFLETFVLLLKLFEHFCEVFEFLRAFQILALELSKFLFILPFNFSYDVLESALALPK